MKDWSVLAKAGGLEIPAKELERLAQPLNALDEVFRPLVQSLTPEMEPASIFRADEETS
jgi:hypothetical protein